MYIGRKKIKCKSKEFELKEINKAIKSMDKYLGITVIKDDTEKDEIKIRIYGLQVKDCNIGFISEEDNYISVKNAKKEIVSILKPERVITTVYSDKDELGHDVIEQYIKKLNTVKNLVVVNKEYTSTDYKITCKQKDYKEIEEKLIAALNKKKLEDVKFENMPNQEDNQAENIRKVWSCFKESQDIPKKDGKSKIEWILR